MYWQPTRQAAFDQLRYFCPVAGHQYANRRNYDFGPENRGNISCLSPWIRHRLLLEDEVIENVIKQHGYEASDKFVQEVFWRTYWKGWLQMRPSIWRDYRQELDGWLQELEADQDLKLRWRAAVEGTTGIDCFDHWVRELACNGYLHNHARMWFASIWIFTLRLPWQLGADFFLGHLLDGDAASNTLGWRWVAGIQTPGKTYLARAENIAEYTNGRFHPHGQLAEIAEPVAEVTLPATGSAPERKTLPSIDEDCALLLTDDDLVPETLPLSLSGIREAAVIDSSAMRSSLAIGEPVKRFTAGAIADTEERLAERQVRLTHCEGTKSLNEWLARSEARKIIMPYTPVGPACDCLNDIKASIKANDQDLVPVLRDWDALAWPHATRGFFRFRKNIPTILRQLGYTES